MSSPPQPIAKPLFWSRKEFWDGAVMVAGCLAAACAVGTALLSGDWKWCFAVPGGIAASGTAIFTRRSKHLDDEQKAKKSAEEKTERERQRAETDAERERHRDELGAAKQELEAVKQKAKTITHRAVKQVLDSLKTELYEQVEAPMKGRKYLVRVTLFECVERDGGQKWLTIYARVGANERSSRCWAVTHDEPTKCRGIAGKIWCEEATRTIQAVVDWSDDRAARIKYAESLEATIEEAESLTTKSVGFAGTPVEVAGNKRWGVLLVDYRERGFVIPTPTSPGDKAKVKQQIATIERCADLLGAILQEGKA